MGSAPGESDFVPGLEQIRRGPGNEGRNRYVYCYMEYKRRIAEAMIREGEQAFLKKGGVLKAVEIRKGRYGLTPLLLYISKTTKQDQSRVVENSPSYCMIGCWSKDS